MKTRREFCQVCIANAVLGSLPPSDARSPFLPRTVGRQERPAVNLAGWQATLLFDVAGMPESLLSDGEVFFESPRRVHLPSGSASVVRSARVLAIAFNEEGKMLVTRP